MESSANGFNDCDIKVASQSARLKTKKLPRELSSSGARVAKEAVQLSH